MGFVADNESMYDSAANCEQYNTYRYLRIRVLLSRRRKLSAFIKLSVYCLEQLNNDQNSSAVEDTAMLFSFVRVQSQGTTRR